MSKPFYFLLGEKFDVAFTQILLLFIFGRFDEIFGLARRPHFKQPLLRMTVQD